MIVRLCTAFVASGAVSAGLLALGLFVAPPAHAHDHEDPYVWSLGVCRTFLAGPGHPFTHCAPNVSPDGARLVDIHEDGSATYTDGAQWDRERLTFVAH